MKVYQLTYRSKAIEDITPNSIYEIVKVANEFNPTVGITGCLVFDNGYFIQILEGEKEVVEELYFKIKQDKRHSFASVLSKDFTAKRFFDKWDMAYMNLTDLSVGDKNELVQKAQAEIKNITTKESFTTKVFWYNINELLGEDRFYRTAGPIG
ncbi:MAG: BLUF domain-containing protein [Eudoraea sp.]|nr:BLUF domain-containing protein [Eudoraea sp.]